MVPLLIDHYVTDPDSEIVAQRVVAAAPEETFAAAKSLDLLEVRTPLLVASFWARDLPAKILRRPELPPPEKLSLDGDLGLPGWMLLDESTGHEIVFGAIGVFWTSTIRWNTDVAPSEFAEFDEPGWGKVACHYSTIPFGDRTVLTYGCRTVTTDPDSRRRFRRYWWLVRPFVQHIMNATVRTIADHAESQPG